MPSLVTDQLVWFEVGTMTMPSAEPFVVVRIDLRSCADGQAEAVVMSQHQDRTEAHKEAARLAGRLN